MSTTTLELQFNHQEKSRIFEHIEGGLAQAQRDEFVTDEEMEAFFACYTNPLSGSKLQRQNLI